MKEDPPVARRHVDPPRSLLVACIAQVSSLLADPQTQAVRHAPTTGGQFDSHFESTAAEKYASRLRVVSVRPRTLSIRAPSSPPFLTEDEPVAKREQDNLL